MGLEEEARAAENIFIQTLADWEESVHPDKTERWRICAEGKEPYDVRGV